MPIVYLTATYGLFDLAALQPGERILVHAGAGGVGMAAIQLARRHGAEVYATASPSKRGALEALGIPTERLASSRDLDFRQKFLTATRGEGMDVVLNSLAGEFIDASLELLPRGGRFLEMGKTDLRDPAEVAADHPGTTYTAFDMSEAGVERIGEMLGEVFAGFEAGDLDHAPLAIWDAREAPAAFRHLREGRNVGKLVLRVPVAFDPVRTVLITGGTGGLGALFARHLVEAHGARHLLLASRSGPEAPGAAELHRELTGLGAQVEIRACDVAERDQLEALFATVDPAHPLGAVIHAAGALDDGMVETLDAGRIDRVLAPKVDAAWHLHELTVDLGLSHFVLFSSVAATLGSPGQGNYAAANGFLDGLAQCRRREGLPAISLAWGLWGRESAMTADLGVAELARIRRAGVAPLADPQGLELFDTALHTGPSFALALALERPPLRALADEGLLPPIFSGLVRATERRREATTGQLAALPQAEREGFVLGLVRSEAAAVLGHGSAEAVDPHCAFKDLGFDSLAAVELRNRLNTASGLQLAATVVFDYPSTAALAAHICRNLTASDSTGKPDGQSAESVVNQLETALSEIQTEEERNEVSLRLRALMARLDSNSVQTTQLEDASDEEMFELLDQKLGVSGDD